MVRHHGLLLLGHIPQTQSTRIKASEYPLDEEGDNLNSYGEKNGENLRSWGVRWTLENKFLKEGRAGIKCAARAKGTKQEKYRR